MTDDGIKGKKQSTVFFQILFLNTQNINKNFQKFNLRHYYKDTSQ